MNILDKLEENGLLYKNGMIKKTWGENFEGIEISDKIREAILLQESEEYALFSSEERKEFIFKLFQLVVVGGFLNQYEDVIAPYRDVMRELYKLCVSVRKDASTGQMFIDTHCFSLHAIDKRPVFKSEHPQNLLIVLVQPFTKTVVLLYLMWSRY